jgi:hypothetical protein
MNWPTGPGWWWWLRRTTREYFQANSWERLRWRWQRATRGYSDRDVWGLHSYLGPLIAGAVTQLRDQGRSHPLGMSEEEWKTLLTRIAEPLAREWDRVIETETPEVHRERRDREYRETVTALHLMADHWGDLWD